MNALRCALAALGRRAAAGPPELATGLPCAAWEVPGYRAGCAPHTTFTPTPIFARRYFGVDNVRQAVRRINKMAQRELQVRCSLPRATAPLSLPAACSRAQPPSPAHACCLPCPRTTSLEQEMFQQLYGVRSSSNNNLWLRKKLIEAVNTRPRGAGGERLARASSQPQPLGLPPGPGPSPGGAADTLRRRRKKSSAPARASDGLQVCGTPCGTPCTSGTRRRRLLVVGNMPLTSRLLRCLQADPENAADALLALLGRQDMDGGGAGGADSSE